MLMGTLESNIGRYQLAEQILRSSVAEHVKIVGDDHIGTAVVELAVARTELGNLYNKLGRYEEALKLHDRAC
jgi:tetratricopeptide (TPR) repeat protein